MENERDILNMFGQKKRQEKERISEELYQVYKKLFSILIVRINNIHRSKRISIPCYRL
jgi:hypothetical protein